MTQKSPKLEHYEKRFGIIAVEKGYITPEQLIEALTIQVREDIEQGFHRQIGEIFLNEDIMTADQIEEVVKEIIS